MVYGKGAEAETEPPALNQNNSFLVRLLSLYSHVHLFSQYVNISTQKNDDV